jgi:hypothetical protein
MADRNRRDPSEGEDVRDEEMVRGVGDEDDDLDNTEDLDDEEEEEGSF